MANFICKVGDPSGRVFQQVESAQNDAEARQRLADRGLFVYSVRRQTGFFAPLNGRGRSRVVRGSDFLIFNQQFNTLIKAGLPILKALELLSERAAAPRLRPVLLEVRHRVREGAVLSEAFEAEGVFPKIYTTSLLAGEKSGNISGVLDDYIAFQRVASGFRSRLKTIFIYPTILMVAVVVILSYLVTFVVPRFAELFHELSVPLPTMTKIVLAVSLPLRAHLFQLVVGLAAVVGLLYFWLRTEQGALVIDRLKPKMPLFGDIWLKAQIAQFVRTLATLLKGGTPLVPALVTAADSIGSPLIASRVAQAANRVREGETLSASLAETRIMPGLALEMVEVGEASGALATMLTSVAEFYEEEVNIRLTRALTWVEPVILVVMALVVAFILLSMYLPMFSLSVGTPTG